MTFAFYFLVACDKERGASAEVGLKYLLMGVLSAAFPAFGIGLLVRAESLAAIRLPLLLTAILSMLLGSFAALRQNRVRRMLAYSSITQMGYVLVALLSAGPEGFRAAALFSLAGIPPSAGFTGKFLIFTAALGAGELTLAVIGVIAAAISLYYYLRLIAVLYDTSGQKQLRLPENRTTVPEAITLLLRILLIILLGIFPVPVLDFLSANF